MMLCHMSVNNPSNYSRPQPITKVEELLFNFNANFSDCLVKRRKSLGWTQEILAEKSQVNRVTIARLEKNQQTVTVDVMLKLLHAMGMTVSIVKYTDL